MRTDYYCATPHGIKGWICVIDSHTTVSQKVPFITGFLRNVTLWWTAEIIAAVINAAYSYEKMWSTILQR
jgi:hypothetical protein